MFSLDGQSFDDVVHVTSLREKFSVLNGKNSGRLQSGKMYLEKLGTYINYEMTVQKKATASASDWDRFVNLLMNPYNEHTITLPHFQRLQTFSVYIAEGGRDLIQTTLAGNNNRWGELTLEFVSMDKIEWSATDYQ